MAQTRMKKFVGGKQREVEFKECRFVYLKYIFVHWKFRPYRQLSLLKRRCQKLTLKYFWTL